MMANLLANISFRIVMAVLVAAECLVVFFSTIQAWRFLVVAYMHIDQSWIAAVGGSIAISYVAGLTWVLVLSFRMLIEPW